nr:putative family 17 glucosidase scw4 [Quercus suber]
MHCGHCRVHCSRCGFPAHPVNVGGLDITSTGPVVPSLRLHIVQSSSARSQHSTKCFRSPAETIEGIIVPAWQTIRLQASLTVLGVDFAGSGLDFVPRSTYVLRVGIDTQKQSLQWVRTYESTKQVPEQSPPARYLSWPLGQSRIEIAETRFDILASLYWLVRNASPHTDNARIVRTRYDYAIAYKAVNVRLLFTPYAIIILSPASFCRCFYFLSQPLSFDPCSRCSLAHQKTLANMKSVILGLATLYSIGSAQAQQGIAYSPYHSDSSCKTQDEVNNDFDVIYNNGPATPLIRTYGMECNQVAMVLSAIRSHGSQSQIFAGIDDPTNPEPEIQAMISAANGDWSLFNTVSVGNEGIQNQRYTIDQLSSGLGQVKSELSGAGYNGPVVTVDVFAVYYDQPSLCNVGDHVAVNCHPYFDGGVTFDQAGAFVTDQHQKVMDTCGGKQVVITESGWPSQGSTNRNAVPSLSNQQTAVSSLRNAFPNSGDLILFTSFNDYWKQDNTGLGVEHFWGIFGDSASTPPTRRRSRFRRSNVL